MSVVDSARWPSPVRNSDEIVMHAYSSICTGTQRSAKCVIRTYIHMHTLVECSACIKNIMCVSGKDRR